jgi:hypothetical protein
MSPVIRRIPPAAISVLLITAVAACTSPTSGAPGSAPGPSAGHSAVAAPGGAATQAGPGPGASGTRTAPRKDVIAGLITFNGRLRLSGAHQLNESFSAFPGVTSPKSSCAHIGVVGTPAGNGRIRQFRIPSPPEGSDVTIAAEISPYRGPGTYRKTSLVTAGPGIVIGTASYNVRAAGATTTVTVGTDGSGELVFTGAAAPRTGRPALSGEIRWTCLVQ